MGKQIEAYWRSNLQIIYLSFDKIKFSRNKPAKWVFIYQQPINHYDFAFSVQLKLRLFMANSITRTGEEIIELCRNSIIARVFVETGVSSQQFTVCGLFSWHFTFIILNVFLKIMQIHFLLLGFQIAWSNLPHLSDK